MKLPNINPISKQRFDTTNFFGVNHMPVISDGELSDALNMSNDFLPALSVRQKSNSSSFIQENSWFRYKTNGKIYTFEHSGYLYQFADVTALEDHFSDREEISAGDSFAAVITKTGNCVKICDFISEPCQIIKNASNAVILNGSNMFLIDITNETTVYAEKMNYSYIAVDDKKGLIEYQKEDGTTGINDGKKYIRLTLMYTDSLDNPVNIKSTYVYDKKSDINESELTEDNVRDMYICRDGGIYRCNKFTDEDQTKYYLEAVEEVYYCFCMPVNDQQALHKAGYMLENGDHIFVDLNNWEFGIPINGKWRYAFSRIPEYFEIEAARASANVPEAVYFCRVPAYPEDLFYILKRNRNWMYLKSGSKIERKIPPLDGICASGNRIWGYSNKEKSIFGSALGKPKNWYQHQGTLLDSYTTAIGEDEKLTGCITYDDNPVFFCENRIITLYGNRPTNYQISSFTAPGVKDGAYRSLTVLNNAVYYASPYGIYRYTGSMPSDISETVHKPGRDNYICGGFDDKLYVYYEEGEKCGIYVFDTLKRLWQRMNSQKIFGMATAPTSLVIDEKSGEGAIQKTIGTSSGNEDDIEWYAVTGDIYAGEPNKKYYSNIQIGYELARNASMKIYIQYNEDGLWRHALSLRGEDVRKSRSANIYPKRCDSMRIKFCGRGDCRIFNISKYIRVGVRNNGDL